MAERLIRGMTLEQRRQERRAALLASALELFGVNGFTATRVEDICRGANVSTRNFYEEFDNRLAVLRTVDEQIAQEVLETLVAVEVEPGPDLVARRTQERVTALVHALVDDPRVARVMFVESIVGWAQDPRLMSDVVGRFPRWLHEFWRDHLDGMGMPVERQRALVLAVVGGAVALLIDRVGDPDPPPIGETIDAIVELATVVIRLPRPGDDAAGTTPDGGTAPPA
jgi:AcrR family transcriptional regulator